MMKGLFPLFLSYIRIKINICKFCTKQSLITAFQLKKALHFDFTVKWVREWPMCSAHHAKINCDVTFICSQSCHRIYRSTINKKNDHINLCLVLYSDFFLNNFLHSRGVRDVTYCTLSLTRLCIHQFVAFCEKTQEERHTLIQHSFSDQDPTRGPKSLFLSIILPLSQCKFFKIFLENPFSSLPSVPLP